MKQWIIDKKDIAKLAGAVETNGDFYAPVRREYGIWLARFTGNEAVEFNHVNVKLPPKREMFPWCEPICVYKNGKAEQASVPERTKVLFGLRPCDVVSLVLLDKVFLDTDTKDTANARTYVDPYYQKRRENALLITLSCNEPADTCFCTSVGGNPFGTRGADIAAADIGDSLLFEAVSEKGQAFINKHEKLFRKAGTKDLQARDEKKTAADNKMQRLDLQDVPAKLDHNFDSPVWEQTAMRCLACGTCTYLCPTCHCFGLHEEALPEGPGRIRVQDACMLASFTLEASGHNPRTTQGERLRQRIMHKFRYAYENWGEVFCVGCGRCVTHCPVNVDIRETVIEASR